MSKLRLFAALLLVCFLATSCYTSRVFHGNVTDNTPQVEVASRKNHILLWGLLPLSSASQEAKNSVGDARNYTTKTTHTFVDGLLSSLTFGIYTPTTTKYLVPLNER
jgi:hypothetical protein